MIRVLSIFILVSMAVICQSQGVDPYKETAKLKKQATYIMVLTHDSLHNAYRKMRLTAEQLGFTVDYTDSIRQIIQISYTTKDKDPLQSRISIQFRKDTVLTKIFLTGEVLNFQKIQIAVNGGPRSYTARRCFMQLYILASRYGLGVISAGIGRPPELYPHVKKGVNGVVVRTGKNQEENMRLINSVAERYHLHDVITPSDNRSKELNEDYHREGTQWLSWESYLPSDGDASPSYRALLQAKDSVILITGVLNYESEVSRDFVSGLTGVSFYKGVPIINPWEEDYKTFSYSNPKRELNYLRSAFGELLEIADWFRPYPFEFVVLQPAKNGETK